MPRVDAEKRKWWILVAMGMVLGITVLDETVVGMALPTIRSELELSTASAHWAVNAYLLVFTGFVIVGGRLGDSLGHGEFFQFGVALFAAASLLAGLAPDGIWLISARALQGLGVAIVFPASFAMITAVFPQNERGRAFGIATTVAGVFMAMGPLVGGFFSEFLSWRWIFWINLPIMAAIALVVWAAWPKPDERPRLGHALSPAALDYPGLVTLVAGLCALVIALMQGEEWGWGAPVTLSLLLGGTLAIALFVLLEARRPRPLVDLELFRNATFDGAILVFFAFQFNKMAVFVFVALYLQEVVKMNATAAGLLVLLAVVPALLSSAPAGRLADRWGSRRPALAGLLVNGAALAVIGALAPLARYDLMILPLVVWGATLPFLAVSARRAVMQAVPPAQHGQAGGINLTVQMLGGTLGVALCGAIYAATGDFRLVFLASGAQAGLMLIVAWFSLDRHEG